MDEEIQEQMPDDVRVLLAKRNKLLSLREAVISRGRFINEGNENGFDMRLDSPDTPQSTITDVSITPPPFSPLTPLVDKLRKNVQDNKETTSNPDTPSMSVNNEMENKRNQEVSSPNILEDFCNDLSPFTINKSMNIEPNSSPIRSMSPETQELFNVLTDSRKYFRNKPQERNCKENSDASEQVSDCDDSVADPNFECVMDDISETDCDSCNEKENDEVIEKDTKDVNTNTKSPQNSKNETDDILIPHMLDQEKDKNSLVENRNDANQVKDSEGASTSGRPKKGRKRKHPQSDAERKFNKYNNLEYTTLKKQKKIEPKIFINYQCRCKNECATLISAEDRKKEFEKYVKLGSYNSQLLYIASCVKEAPKKRSYTMMSVPPEKKKPRKFNRTFTLNGVKVCRDMFLKTLQISCQKISITLKKVRNNKIFDGRGIFNEGGQGGVNKLTKEQIDFIVSVIANLPKYESHYRRDNSNGALYLQPGMTLSKIYEIYQKKFAEQFGPDKKCASFSSVKRIFMTKFNLKCKALKKDTCNRCDMFAIQLKDAKNNAEKEKIEAEKSMHLEKAETMRKLMKADFETAQSTPTVECLSFDLEKTLPLPRIPTNVVFYKRQLWLYNGGIHSASDNVGHCYVWVEGEAGRGAQEVGSCLMRYIETKLRPTTEHLILWSDCCGGQNRNIKIVLLLKTALNSHPTLKSISFRYLESGHSFLPNDTDFSKIETALKKQQRIYTAEEYMEVMRTAKKRNPFQVYKMEKMDFFGTEVIERNIVNRKKYTDKSKVNWLQAKEIKITKDKLYSIFMRTSVNEDFMELDIQKKIKGKQFSIKETDLKELWPNGKPIAPAKLADLESLYKYIPNDCLPFYKSLTASDQATDDVDGFGSTLDFEKDEDIVEDSLAKD